MLEAMRKETEKANAAIIVEKDGTDQMLVHEKLHRRNNVDELESMQNRLEMSIQSKEAIQQENRKLQRVSTLHYEHCDINMMPLAQVVKTLEEQKRAALQAAKDLESSHEKNLQQMQKKLARTNKALDNMRKVCREVSLAFW